MNSELERFAQAIGSNPAMRDELAALGASDTASIVAFANSKGYNFTAKDIPSAAAISGAGELSESQLGSVVGGATSILVISSEGGYVYAGAGWALYKR